MKRAMKFGNGDCSTKMTAKHNGTDRKRTLYNLRYTREVIIMDKEELVYEERFGIKGFL